MLPVGSAAAPVKKEKLELACGPEEVSSEGVLDEVVERLGVTGGAGPTDDDAEDETTGNEEPGSTEDAGGAEDGSTSNRTTKLRNDSWDDSTIMSGGQSVGVGSASDRVEVAQTLSTGETEMRLKVA
ncbi:hypothetical protein ACEQ8H_002093 [Pleosporales sp. CAS-2024a]